MPYESCAWKLRWDEKQRKAETPSTFDKLSWLSVSNELCIPPALPWRDTSHTMLRNMVTVKPFLSSFQVHTWCHGCHRCDTLTAVPVWNKLFCLLISRLKFLREETKPALFQPVREFSTPFFIPVIARVLKSREKVGNIFVPALDFDFFLNLIFFLWIEERKEMAGVTANPCPLS